MQSFYVATDRDFERNLSRQDKSRLEIERKNLEKMNAEKAEFERLKNEFPEGLASNMQELKPYFEAVKGVDLEKLETLNKLLEKKPDRNYSKSEDETISRFLDSILLAEIVSKMHDFYGSNNLILTDTLNLENLKDDVIESVVEKLGGSNGEYVLERLIEGDISSNWLDKSVVYFKKAFNNEVGHERGLAS